MGRRLFQTDGPPTQLDLPGGTVFFVGIGVLVTWVLLKPISRDMASPSWPATSALVLASTVERCVDGAGASHFLNYR